MFTRPADLSDEMVAAAIHDSWGIEVEGIDYAPVGFGSHHWLVEAAADRWFVTVDDLYRRLREKSDTYTAARARVTDALSTARELRLDGQDFVVAPVPSRFGEIGKAIGDRYLLAVYPHVEGIAGEFGGFGSATERLDVVDCLVRLHDAGTSVPARIDDLSIPSHQGLHEAMGALSDTWSNGPFGEATRKLVQRHRGALRSALTAYDRLAAEVRSSGRSLVITHGEPHRGNVIVTKEGPMLIDWDTTLLAPPERDLWSLIEEDVEVRDHYERRSGRVLDDRALRVFRLWWDLCEVALYVNDFRRPHGDSTDTRTAWGDLEHHLDPARWADLI